MDIGKPTEIVEIPEPVHVPDTVPAEPVKTPEQVPA